MNCRITDCKVVLGEGSIVSVPPITLLTMKYMTLIMELFGK